MNIVYHDKTGKILKPKDAARVCPICKTKPTFRDDGHGKLEVLCLEHWGYMAMGDNEEQAASHWNRFIAFIAKETAVGAATTGAGSMKSSPCFFCKANTEGTTYSDDRGTLVECNVCHLPKYQRQPKRVKARA